MRKTLASISLICVLFGALYFLFRLFFCVVTIKGNSMYPTYSDGDKVLVLKTNNVSRGDVVLVNVPSVISVVSPDRLNIKRLFAMPGDTICAENGMWINKSTNLEGVLPFMSQAIASESIEKLEKEYGVFTSVFPFDAPTDNIITTPPRIIPFKGMMIKSDSFYSRVIAYDSCNLESDEFKKDYCFILGDNSFDSRDSRYYGPVPLEQIKGKVLCRIKNNLDKELEIVLQRSGQNRAELEKVLAYCRKDDLKYRSAVYLIRNMPNHYSYILTAEDEKVKCELAEMCKSTNASALESHPVNKRKKQNDLDIVTADFLIENINEAVDVYRNRPWNKTLPFEAFCELILPYRVGTEPLQPWRKTYRERFSYILDSLYTGNDPIDAVNVIYDALNGQLFRYCPSIRLPNLGPSFLLDNRIGGCREICDFTLYLCRALGLPVAMDFYNQENIHSWNVVRDVDGKYVQFLFDRYGGNMAVRGGGDGRTKGKVWRQRFSSPYISDVTSDYFPENKYRIKVAYGLPNRTIGLGMFVNTHWYSVAKYKSSWNKVTYRNIEPETVYIAMDKDSKTISYPFIPHYDGSVTLLTPNIKVTRRVELKRKIRITHYLKSRMREVDGTSVWGYDSLNGCLDSLGCLYSTISNDEILAVDGKEYDHLIIKPNESGVVCLSELCIISEDGLMVRFDNADELCDDDPLTYHTQTGDLVLSLKCRVKIQSIVWTPKNDDNFIRAGDIYELFYQGGTDGWVSLGRQKAITNRLVYDNVPNNALLWLHNYMRGREEEVFIVDEKGEQVFL